MFFVYFSSIFIDLQNPDFCFENTDFPIILRNLEPMTITCIYLRAQEELVGQTVIVAY